MATPRAAKHKDLEQRFRDLEDKLRELTGVVLRRERLEVTEGDFQVSGGGDITISGGGSLQVLDAGNIEARGGGSIAYFDSGGTQRIDVGEKRDGNINMEFRDLSGRLRTMVGTIYDVDTGAVQGDGILVQMADGTDVVNVSEDQVRFRTTQGVVLDAGENVDDQIDLYGLGGKLRATLGPVTWNGQPDGYGVYVAGADGRDVFYAGQTAFRWHRAGDLAFNVDVLSRNTTIGGGLTDDGNGWRTSLVLNGGDEASAREVRARDGGNTGYVPMAASEFSVRSSSRETKTVLGEPEGSLAKVRATPIKRWQHKHGGCDSTEGAVPDEAPVRMGPMAEEVPAEMADWTDEGGGVSLTAAVWTLWDAVRELSEKVDRLTTD